MAEDNIKIYEFSTGIHAERTQDGGWISRGFTGYYMNVTWSDGEIPYEIRRAIANKYFTVSEGGRIDRPALIGRVIQGQDQSWSVLAIVSRGIDDGGRPLSVYRYFFTKGDLFWKLLRWLEDYQNKNDGRFPVFDPLTPKSEGRYETFPVSPEQAINLPLDEDERKKLPQESLPIICTDSQKNLYINSDFQLTYPDPKLKYQFIYWLSLIRSNNVKIPLAFAYNACALENPRTFTVIHAANEEFAGRIRQSLGTALPALPPVSKGAVQTDEQLIKSAILTLMKRAKPEAIKIIADAMENEAITDEYWNTWFDAQGAKEALKQPISSPQMARLLTLRAIVIRGGKGKIDQEEWKKHPINQSFRQECNDFEKQFVDNYPNPNRVQLDEKIKEDVESLFEQILQLQQLKDKKSKEQQIKIESILRDQESLWGEYSKKAYFSDILNFINQVNKYQNKQEREQEIERISTSEIVKYPLKVISNYKASQTPNQAEHRSNTGDKKYWVSQISKSIRKEVGEIINYCQPTMARFKEQPKTFPKTTQDNPNVAIPKNLEENANNSLTTTTAMCLKQIMDDQKHQFFQSKISDELIYILIIKALEGNPNKLNIDLILDPVSLGSREEKQEWINTIYNYQTDKIDSPNGIISYENQQFVYRLKDDFNKQCVKYEMAILYFNETQSCILEIVKLLSCEFKCDRNKIYDYLKYILKTSDHLKYIESQNLSDTEKWKLIEAIEFYQKDLDPRPAHLGFISNNQQNTYKVLYEDLHKSLSGNTNG